MIIGKNNIKKIFIYFLAIILILISIIFINQKKFFAKNSGISLNEEVPQFKAINLYDENQVLTNYDIEKKTTIINFFASWCIPCKAEHHLLLKLNTDFPDLVIVGINHKDNIDDALEFIEKNGNPYDFIGLDLNGDIAQKFGVFGLPETLLTNNNGQIIYKHIGPISGNVIKNEIIPLL